MKRPRFCYWIHSTLKEEVQITFVHILLNFANHNLKTIVELEVHPTLLKRRGSKTTARGGGTLGGAGGERGIGGEELRPPGGPIQFNISMNELAVDNINSFITRCPSKSTSPWTSWLWTTRQPIAVSDISIYICLIDIRSKSISISEANPKNNWMRGEQACLFFIHVH